MKKNIVTVILSLFTILSFSQTIEYPRIETDSLGNKILVMTIHQAQMVDNKLELLKLFEKQGLQCDSLNTAYLKVIDKLNNQVILLELNVKTLKEQLNDKDKQIDNLQQQLDNEKSSSDLCEYQKNNKDEEIKILKKEIKKHKFQKVVGFVVGGVGVVGGILIIISNEKK
jgi:peptidoglycan hydrolase CwlO-like protein